MKFFTSILAGLSVVAAATLQQFFPPCSVDCLTSAIGTATTCKADDGVCICVFDNYVSVVDAATNCVIQACGADDAVHKVLPAAADFCAAVSSSAGIATSTSTGTARSSSSSSPATMTSSAQMTSSATPSASASNAAASSTSRTSTNGAAPTAGARGLAAVLMVGAALL